MEMGTGRELQTFQLSSKEWSRPRRRRRVSVRSNAFCLFGSVSSAPCRRLQTFSGRRCFILPSQFWCEANPKDRAKHCDRPNGWPGLKPRVTSHRVRGGRTVKIANPHCEAPPSAFAQSRSWELHAQPLPFPKLLL